MKIKVLLNGIINYAAAVALAVVFALYMSGRVGWFITIAFICAPIISVLLTKLCMTRLSIECENNFHALCKGESCRFGIRVINDFFLPSPPVMIDASDSPRAVCGKKGCSVSVLPYSAESVSFDFTARICGPADIGVKKISVTDFFGLFSFPLKNADMSKLFVSVPVIPDIADVQADDNVIKSALIASMLADNSEETTEASMNTFGGFPGFENREYVPGDPLKRVNWKQSAKRGKLLVRLDDETACSAISVVLDSTFVSDKIFPPAFLGEEMFAGCTAEDVVPMISQSAVETSLGTVRTLMESGCAVSFVIMTNDGWISYPANDDNDLSMLRTELATYKFESAYGKSRFPYDELAQKSCSVAILCTPYLDKALSDTTDLSGTSDGKVGLTIVMSAAAVAPDVTVKGKEAAVNG